MRVRSSAGSSARHREKGAPKRTARNGNPCTGLCTLVKWPVPARIAEALDRGRGVIEFGDWPQRRFKVEDAEDRLNAWYDRSAVAEAAALSRSRPSLTGGGWGRLPR